MLRFRLSLAHALTTGHARGAATVLLLGALGAPASHLDQTVRPYTTALAVVQANDNRARAGIRRNDTLELHLVVRMAEWRPESNSGPAVAVAAFAEEGKAPQIPAPLIRTREGTILSVSVRNALRDSTIGVIGLATHPSREHDTLFVHPGETKRVRFAAGSAGTYLYRALLGDTTREREQVAGAFVVDPRGGSLPDRVFVINIWSDSNSNALTINGRSWPWTERINAIVGDTLRWRVVNASNRTHPMHLHGAYFRVRSKGDAFADTSYAPSASRLAVTEHMREEETMLIDWSPVRPGRWLFHCHIAFHVIPTSARLVPAAYGSHDEGSSDPLEHMAGLVLGIDARLRPGEREARPAQSRRLDLYIQERGKASRLQPLFGFVLQQGASPPAPDSVVNPGTTIVLTRDEPTDVQVHNRLKETTAVHWHGLELESFSDGVPGWSGNSLGTAHSIPPGGTFLAHLSMPRAGTFIYHTHMRDLMQLTGGLYGAIVVLEPGQKFDPRTDHVFVSGWELNSDKRGIHVLVNGDSISSPALDVHVGEPQRFRFVNMAPADPMFYSLRRDTTMMEWRALAKDGADLPASQAIVGPARVAVDVGETYDFEFTPTIAGEYTLSAPVMPEGGKDRRWTRRIIAR